MGLEASLYQILQILSVTLFEKTPILRLAPSDSHENLLDDPNQHYSTFNRTVVVIPN